MSVYPLPPKPVSTSSMRLIILIMLGVTLFGRHTVADEPDPLDDGVARLAEAITRFFDQEMIERTTTVAGVVDQDAGSDAAIYEKLLAELKNPPNNFSIARSDTIINVRKTKVELPDGDDENPRVALKLTAEIRQRRTDSVIGNIAIPVFGSSALLHLNPTLAISTSLKVTEAQRQQEIIAALDNPVTAFQDNQVLAAEGSRFGVEVRTVRERRIVQGVSVVTQSDSCVPADVDGLAFVPLKKGDEYLIRIHNHSDFEVACSVIIDGLSMFAFSEEGNFGSQVIVAPGSFQDIPGWYVNSRSTDVFEVGQYAKSAAQSKNIPMSATGTITVSFQACWSPNGTPPADEFRTKSGGSATTRGQRIEQHYVQVPKVIGRERAFVTVRYQR